jgi:hypothetical protein
MVDTKADKPAAFAIVPIKPPVNADVVTTLEDLLVQARAGRISYLAYVLERPQGRFNSSWCGDGSDCLKISGLLHHLAFRYDRAVDDKPDVPDDAPPAS